MSKVVAIGLLAAAGAGVALLIRRGTRINSGALGRPSRFPITVSDRKHGEGFQVCADDDGAKIGCVLVNVIEEDPVQPFAVGYSWVDDEYQRQGVATNLYEKAAQEACSMGKPLQSDFMLTPERKKFWEKQVRKGRAIKLTRKSGKKEIEFYRLKCPAPSSLSSAIHSLYAMPDRWWNEKPPREKKLCYKTKKDALKVFMDWNSDVVEEYGGPTASGSGGEFDAMTKYGVLPTNIAEAVWVSLPAPPRGRKFCLEDIDVDALNDTSPGRNHYVGFQLPDYVVEEKLIEAQYRHYQDEYDDVPF